MLPPEPPPEPMVSLSAEVPGIPFASRELCFKLMDPVVDNQMIPAPELPRPPARVPLPPPDPSYLASFPQQYGYGTLH